VSNETALIFKIFTQIIAYHSAATFVIRVRILQLLYLSSLLHSRPPFGMPLSGGVPGSGTAHERPYEALINVAQ